MLQSNFGRLGLLAAAAALSVGRVAKATFTINIDQIGGDVVSTGTGTIDTTDLAFAGNFNIYAGITPDTAEAVGGPSGHFTGSGFYDNLDGPLPSSFGSGGAAYPSSGSGDSAGFATDFIILPENYVSGAALYNTDTYAGASLSSLGLTPGTYTVNFGTGPDADSVVINVAVLSSPSVPEPASIAAAGLALPALGLFAWKRRKLMA
jgi:hypothetical protein